MIPPQAHEDAMREASQSDVMILIGTTGEVMPAAMIPRLAKSNGAFIIEVNPTESLYTHEITDLFLRGKAGYIMNELGNRLFEGAE
jgi:NAD-dependent deacetylase